MKNTPTRVKTKKTITKLNKYGSKMGKKTVAMEKDKYRKNVKPGRKVKSK